MSSFAIPVTTRYVADFLGFGHLIRDEKTPKAPYSENEIYQHITNCQIFLSYNADETKLLKRRKAFTSSLQFLYKLAMNGNILEAGRWPLAAVLFGRKSDNAMTELGFKVALHVLEHEKDQEKAAGILVFVGLHTAYNSVLAVSFLECLTRLLLTLDLVLFSAQSVHEGDVRICQLKAHAPCEASMVEGAGARLQGGREQF